jgi:iron complex transport system substrate-binding protein
MPAARRYRPASPCGLITRGDRDSSGYASACGADRTAWSVVIGRSPRSAGWVVVALVLLASACSHDPEAPAAAPAAAPEHGAAQVGATPQRIVALTCGAVDIITALGGLDLIIAVEEDCPAPGTQDKIKIRNDDHPGQVQIVQVEAIMALKPDLVIAKADLKEVLGDRGMRMIWSPPVVDLASLPGFVDDIANALGMRDKGDALIVAMHAREQRLRRRTAPLPRTRVYYEVNGAGRTAGTGTIIDAMIRLAGGASIVGDDPRPNISMSPEAVVVADPEVIILGPFAESIEAVRTRPGWEHVAAVKSGRIFKVPELQRYAVLGSPRCVQGCEELLLPWIHPELGTRALGP